MKIILIAALISAPAGAAAAEAPPPAMDLYGIGKGIEREIKDRVLDPMLGAGKAHAFVEVEFALKRRTHASRRVGLGYALHRKDKSPAAGGNSGEDLFKALSFEEADRDQGPPAPTPGRALSQSEQVQFSRQEKTEDEDVASLSLVPKRFTVRILHDSGIKSAGLDEVRRVLTAAYGESLRPKDIIFISADLRAR